MADFATITKNMRENIHIISTARMIAEITNCVFITPNIKNGISKCMLQIRFVPWVCTWLSTYEYWLVTGKWHYDEMFTGRNQIKEWKKEK